MGDPFTTKVPTGPNSYRLPHPRTRQTTAPVPTNEARASALKAPTTSFDPSKPSFKPVKSLKQFDNLDNILAKRKQDTTPEQIRIQKLEDAVTMYSGSHQLQLSKFSYESEMRAEQMAEQIAEQMQAQADENQAHAQQIKAEADQAKVEAKLAQQQAENAQAKAEQFQEQAEKTSSEVTGLRNVLRSDFKAIGSHFKTADNAISALTARLEAADQERTWMANHMKIKTLAEAESHELMAKRLRESVLGPDAGGLLQGGMARLQLTAESSQRQKNIAVESPVHAEEPVEVSSPTVADEEVPETQAKTEVAGPETQAISSEWRPHAVAQLAPLSISVANDVTFTWEQLHRDLGGAQYSPGLYLASSGNILKGNTFWLLEAQFEPFAPTQPGQHGAKLTPFFNDTPTEHGLVPGEEDYSNVPVFVCPEQGQEYTYLGTYSQTRYSDKLSHSELFQHVPEGVLKYWAAMLAVSERPAWVTDQLIAHFWPAPTYDGPIPTDVAVATPATGASDPRDPEKPIEKRVIRALEQFAIELRDWKKESQLKVQLLTEEVLTEMWKKSDLDEEKGLRPWLEYLECVGFDGEFYEKLVAAKQGKGKVAVASKGEPSMAGSATPRANGGNKGEQRRDSAADVPELVLDEAPFKEAKFKRTKRPSPGDRQGRSTTRR
jgi:hypothetical protein